MNCSARGYNHAKPGPAPVPEPSSFRLVDEDGAECCVGCIKRDRADDAVCVVHVDVVSREATAGRRGGPAPGACRDRRGERRGPPARMTRRSPWPVVGHPSGRRRSQQELQVEGMVVRPGEARGNDSRTIAPTMTGSRARVPEMTCPDVTPRRPVRSPAGHVPGSTSTSPVTAWPTRFATERRTDRISDVGEAFGVASNAGD